MEKTEKFTNYQIIAVVLLALLQFTVVLDFMVISPIGDLLIKSLVITTEQFGLVVSVYAFSAATSGIISAGFVDKFDRKKVLMFFFSGFIVGTFLCAVSNTYITLLIARIITGVFGGVISSVIMTIVSDLFAPNQRGRAISGVQMANAASLILGVPLGLFISYKFDWHSSFFLLVILSTIILFVIYFKLKPIDKHLVSKSDKHPLLHLWLTLINKNYQVGFVAITLLSIGGFMLMPFTSIFLINNIRLSHAQLPLIFMITGLSALIIMPIVGKLSDKFDKFKIFVSGSVIAIITIFIYTHLSGVPFWVVLSMNIIMFAALVSRTVPFQSINLMVPNKNDTGAYMSISDSLQQLAGGLGAIIASQIAFQATPTSPLENYGVLGDVVIVISILVCVLGYYVNSIARANHQNSKNIENN